MNFLETKVKRKLSNNCFFKIKNFWKLFKNKEDSFQILEPREFFVYMGIFRL